MKIIDCENGSSRYVPDDDEIIVYVRYSKMSYFDPSTPSVRTMAATISTEAGDRDSVVSALAYLNREGA